MGKLRISDGIDVHYGSITAKGGIDGLTLSNGISGSNFNISGVNELSISDPGEGIVFGGGSSGNITLAVVDDSSDNILRLSGTGATLQVGTNRVLTTADEGSGNGLDADTLDGNHASAFLTSYTETDTLATVTGRGSSTTTNVTLSGTGNHFSGHHYFDPWDANGNHYPHYLSGSSNNGAQVNLRVQQSGSSNYDVLYIAAGSNNMTWRGNKIWNAGNDGANSGLDADKLDGQQNTQFFRSLSGGTGSSINSYTDNGFRTLSYSGYSSILWSNNQGGSTGTVQLEFEYNTPARGFKVRNKTDNNTWSSTGWVAMTTSNQGHISGTIWHSGNDGSGSGLDADTLDGNHASAFLTSESDTLASVTGRGASTSTTLSLAGGVNIVANPLRFQRSSSSQTGQDDNVSVTVDDSNIYFTHNNDADGDASGFNFRYSTGGTTANLLNFSASSLTYKGNTIWHSGNDGSGTGLDADLLDGMNTKSATGAAGSNQILRTHSNGYLYMQNWIDIGTSGLYSTSSSGNGAHFYPNTVSDYGAWRMNGSRNGWGGITFDVSGTNNTLMANATRIGFYNDADNEWLIDCNRNGSVDMYYDGTMRLWTKSTGIGVAGGITSTGSWSYTNGSYGTQTIGYYYGAAYWYNTALSYYVGSVTGSTTTQNKLYVRGAISVGSATASSTWGRIDASNDIVAYSSDKRLKENILPINSALDKISKLSGFTYNWNQKAKEEAAFNTEERLVGVFAQDVQEVLPEAVKIAPFDNDGNDVSKSGENYLTVQYEKIVPLLIEGIKEQQAQINELTTILEQLTKQLKNGNNI